MIRHLAPMHSCRTLPRSAAALPALLLACWTAVPCSGEELWAKPVAVGGRWQLYQETASVAPPLQLVVEQHYGRLNGRASDGRTASGSVDGHHIRFRLHCTTETSTCHETAYAGELVGAYIDGTVKQGELRQRFRAHIERRFSLTFDDGPVAEGTPRVLAQLAQLTNPADEPIKAAFFFVAEAPSSMWDRLGHYAPFELWREKGSITANPGLTHSVVQAGHHIGNHTHHHSWAWWPWHNDDAAIRQAIKGWERVARENGIDGYSYIFRPPYLNRLEDHAAISSELGYSTISGYSSGDAEPGATLYSVQQRALNSLEYCAEFSCPLIFHDMRPVPQQHLREVVAFLQRHGFVLVDFTPPPQPQVAQQVKHLGWAQH